MYSDSSSELIQKAERFCNQINAELVYINEDRFALKLSSGETRFIYWSQLDRIIHDSGLQEKKMNKMEELKRRRNRFEDDKVYGKNWEDFLNNLADSGYDFNDHYYDMPYHWIDAVKDDVVYEIEVEKYSDGTFETIGFGEIPEELLKKAESLDNDREVLREAERFSHRIVILPKDSGFKFNSSAEKKLRFKSQKEAEDYMKQLLSGSFAVKLKNKGLSLAVEEIPKKPRRTGTNDPDYENPFEVGDILFGDVGYSMSLPEWWKVIKKTDKTVTCKRLATIVTDHDGYGQRGYEMPDPDAFYVSRATVNGKPADAPQTMRVKKWSGTTASWHSEGKDQYYASLGGSRYGNIFSLWDGKPKSFDYYD